MKKVLGLDLGTTSIGWALVNQAEDDNEKSSIIKAGVRVNPISSDEKDKFEKGKAATTNADRTAARSARRNIQRYKLRRDQLVNIFKREGWITDETPLYECGQYSTYKTYELRAKASVEQISLSDFARVLLMINKKRGYKSGRKDAVGEDAGHLIDGIEVARILQEKNLTPGQYAYELVKDNRKVPDFYKSDLETELERVWVNQQKFYPEILTSSFREMIDGKRSSAVKSLFINEYKLFTADNKGKDRKRNKYLWRSQALSNIQELEPKQVAYVIVDIIGDIDAANGYLGRISNLSKEIAFAGKTVGQYMFSKISENHHFSTRNMIFYRQDYMDEFNRIWQVQSEFHPELTDDLRLEIGNKTIFYQRNLKSQKKLISFCEFESKPITVIIDGKEKQKIQGCRVAPKSSLVFQEFKIWQILNNLTITNKRNFQQDELSDAQKNLLFEELSVKGTLLDKDVLTILGFKAKDYELNYKKVEGNVTLNAFYKKCAEIVEASGHQEVDINKNSAEVVKNTIKSVFVSALRANIDFLNFDSSLCKEDLEQQSSFKLWHLLYSYCGDNSKTGDEKLIEKIMNITGLEKEYAAIFSSIHFPDDYGSLSNKAMLKIIPELKKGFGYDVACLNVGYRHSKSSLTKEEIENKPLQDRLQLIPRGELRNPVVEKILNQMVNVINSIADIYGKPDEIHIELARELKKNAAQRADMTKRNNETALENEKSTKKLKEKFGLSYVSKNDILRYKLYEELAGNGYKTLYSNRKINESMLFSKEIDIEHILPQALCFDDSFANKTLEFRAVNIEKGKETAFDFVKRKYGEIGLLDYQNRVQDLYKTGRISRSKMNNLLMAGKDIPEGFLNRDLSMSQYIAKKAKEMLEAYVKVVVPTSGSITAKLREDWRLVDILKEINMPKYDQKGLVNVVNREDGTQICQIDNWTKRNDHRHHAMDALTIAFTKPSHIQYLNNLNASSDPNSNIYAIRQKETEVVDHKRIFKAPMPLGDLRNAFKNELESILVSVKAKNKVATRNVNKVKTRDGIIRKIELTPRGSFHKDTVYGKRLQYKTYEVAVGSKLTLEEIANVASSKERVTLTQRLLSYNGDAKKAFTGPNSVENNPIYIDSNKLHKIGAKVKCVKFEEVFTVRKDINKDLKLEKVFDRGVRHVLEERLALYNGNADKAFSNIEDNPIWLNKEKSICLKKVTICERLTSLHAIHIKTDIAGKALIDEGGNTLYKDYVNLRNNHHVAIYEDPQGNLQESIVTFMEAVTRMLNGVPVVDKNYRSEDGWRFKFSLKQNEMFVFPDPNTNFYPEKVDLMNHDNFAIISPYLFRVQKVSSSDYGFTHHLETQVPNRDVKLKNLTWRRVTSINNLNGVVKVRLNHLGQIVKVGEDD